jgi:hypothetical protein
LTQATRSITPRECPRAHARLGIVAGANRGADAQAIVAILAGARKVGRLGNILDRDHALELARVVDHQHAFEPVFMQQIEHLVLFGTLGDGYQVFARSHDR